MNDNIVPLYPWSSLPASEQEAQYRQLVTRYGSPLFVVDEAQLRRQVRQLSAALPGVELFYAIKALPRAEVIAALVSEGVGLDIASSGEVALARQSGLSPRATIHTHPIKKDSEIRAALRYGTTTFVVDNREELRKFRRYHNRVGLLIRIRFQGKSAVVDLSSKFGCSPEEAVELLQLARRKGIRIKGFSFHVGSQSGQPDSHVAAIETTHALMERAWAMGFNEINLLDMGGGFPVEYRHAVPEIEDFCAPIRQALDKLPQRVRKVAEPGRYLVAPAVSVITSVVGKSERDGRPWYYLDDGVYGSWSGKLFDHADYPVEVFREGPHRESVLAGPTCDSIDVVEQAIELPKMELGDLVVGHQMGAYTAASATDFNALSRAKIVVVNSRRSEGLAHKRGGIQV
ncbi:MAG: type III PLP-dependent enzyme [Gammaproteobacteria bacterium]|uniref:ornithine decarboxylase n=1 Tax=Candidatus Thiopontia autotrophica TaxID=2841688 RepID=A0A8J6TXV0_9GAMM|nr:type III PLP-dependent enzyme [Candidatus Thiopontia autotrophica]MBL6968840.1 type III PLP-dependent enzyme [Gammaproteobacteria bacterium]